MMKAIHILTAGCLALFIPGCVATTTSSRTWGEPDTRAQWSRPGRVESIREIVQRQEGNPAGGAVAGAVIGGLMFGGRGPGALFGAASGAAIGAASSQGGPERRRYDVLVRFDDGPYQWFSYADASPFRPGEPVLLTPQGLMRL